MKSIDKPTISIALPTFNGERYLETQIESLLSQTLLPNEIVIVDDCSNDKTLKVIFYWKSNCLIKIYKIPTTLVMLKIFLRLWKCVMETLYF